MTCPVCDGSLRRHEPYAHCRKCGYWGAELPHDVEDTSAPETEYELVSYDHTRRANYTAILELLAARHGPKSSLLEIGCADGLFLAMAHERNGYTAIGIEPNVKMTSGNPHRQDIRRGFFPGDLGDAGPTFDVIALNCVFEHVPDVAQMIEQFKAHLKPGGSVMINVPVSSGFMFHASRMLYRARVRYPFDRIWQRGFVSPHLHYFASGNLETLFARHGFALASERALALFSLGGLYARLALDPNIRFVQRVSALGFLYAYYPVSRVAPDARAFVFSMRGAG